MCVCVAIARGNTVGDITLNDTVKVLEFREPEQDKLSLNSEPLLPGKETMHNQSYDFIMIQDVWHVR